MASLDPAPTAHVLEEGRAAEEWRKVCEDYFFHEHPAAEVMFNIFMAAGRISGAQRLHLTQETAVDMTAPSMGLEEKLMRLGFELNGAGAYSLPEARLSAFDHVKDAVRSEYHRNIRSILIHRFHVHLWRLAHPESLSVLPGVSTPSASVASAMKAVEARGSPSSQARYLRDFCATYRSNIGAHPFLAGLRRVLEEQRGVDTCVEWSVDDELFLQSGGPEFIRDALNLLVGALKFQATPPSTTRDPFCAFPPASTSNAAAAAAAGTPPVVPAGAPPASAASAATTTTTAPPPSGGSGVATTTATVSGAGVASTPATPLLASPSASASASTSARQPGAGNGAGSGSGSDSGAQTAHHHHGGSGVAHGRSTASAVPALPSITRRYRCSATMSDACARDLLSELPTAAALDASPCGEVATTHEGRRNRDGHLDPPTSRWRWCAIL